MHGIAYGIGAYMEFCFLTIPQQIFVLLALTSMTSINLIAVKFYGEFEFWFSLIKFFVILAMIVTGFLTIFFGIGIANGGIPTGFSNLWNHE